MILLRSLHLLARIDPQHGAEVLDLIDLATGRQVLGRPPCSSDPPRGGDLDEETWTRSYRGGWQMLAPNAGNSCRVADVQHGFHGRASNDPWMVVAANETSATLVWTGHGMTVTRTYEAGAALRVSVTMKAIHQRVPAVVVEHIALGTELLDPSAIVGLAGGDVRELPTEVGAAFPREAEKWPAARFLDGSSRVIDRVALSSPRSALFGVANLPVGKATVVNEAKMTGVSITWDLDPLKHLWIWQEIRTSPGSWRNAAELLIIEPASVPHHFGLAEAIQREECLWLNPGESKSYSIAIELGKKP
jgi:hypothetical protein